MFNRLYALTTIYYFDPENHYHLDISTIDKLTKSDSEPYQIVVDRYELSQLILTYSTMELRDRAFTSISKLQETNPRGSEL